MFQLNLNTPKCSKFQYQDGKIIPTFVYLQQMWIYWKHIIPLVIQVFQYEYPNA